MEESNKQIKKEINLADLQIKKAKMEEAELKLTQTKQKLAINETNTTGKFGSVTEPRKSLSTYLRNQNKFEVSAISILDRKAAILIKVCPTIISGLIVFHDYIETNVAGGNLIMVILLVGLLTSLILSIMSIKPSTRGFAKIVEKQIKPMYPDKIQNSFYIWEFESYKDYEQAMEQVFKSQNLQLGNQVKANFILAKSNASIAKFLDYAYNAFLASFIVAAIVFLLSNYLTL